MLAKAGEGTSLDAPREIITRSFKRAYRVPKQSFILKSFPL